MAKVVKCKTLDGQSIEFVEDVIGSGAEGMTDGAYDRASFNKPQGVALDGDTLRYE